MRIKKSVLHKRADQRNSAGIMGKSKKAARRQQRRINKLEEKEEENGTFASRIPS